MQDKYTTRNLDLSNVVNYFAECKARKMTFRFNNSLFFGRTDVCRIYREAGPLEIVIE